MLGLTQIDHADLCFGWAWTVVDENLLAERVGRVALGQYRHVATILAGAGTGGPPADADLAAAAIKLLSVEKDQDPSHRDGWLFQTISWIAAHYQHNGGLIRAPQIRRADKGFDGLQLELSEDGTTVVSVIIFEDKATVRPRKTIREEVWPGIDALEAGQRVNELAHEVSAILDGKAHDMPAFNLDEAISNILWKEVRRYRVSITVDESFESAENREKLFDGFDERAPGNVARRRAETLILPDVRKWLESLAQLAVAHIKAIKSV